MSTMLLTLKKMSTFPNEGENSRICVKFFVFFKIFFFFYFMNGKKMYWMWALWKNKISWPKLTWKISILHEWWTCLIFPVRKFQEKENGIQIFNGIWGSRGGITTFLHLVGRPSVWFVRANSTLQFARVNPVPRTK